MFRTTWDETRSLFARVGDHHRQHHPPHRLHHTHGPSLFGIPLSRLRTALYYFTFAIVITTFLYCLVFYESDNARRHTHRRFRYSKLISSSTRDGNGDSRSDPNSDRANGPNAVNDNDDELDAHQSIALLLDDFIRNANVHFVDNYHRRVVLVPTLDASTPHPISLLTAKVATSSLPVDYSRGSKYEVVDDIATTTKNNSKYKKTSDFVRIRLMNDGENARSSNDKMRENERKHELAEEEEEKEEKEEEEVSEYLKIVDEPDSIEHYLEQLGFNIRHITRYLIYTNQSTNHTGGTADRSKTLNQKFISHLTSKFFSTLAPTSMSSLNNRSSVNDLLDLFTTEPEDDVSKNRLIFFVTAIGSPQYSMGYRFIKSFERYRKVMAKQQKQNDSKLHLRLLISDMGLSDAQYFEIETLCNITWQRSKTPLCKIRKFAFDRYPSHVTDPKIAAYRSIIVQEILRDIRRARAAIDRLSSLKPEPTLSPKIDEKNQKIYNLIWLDPHYRFLPATIGRHNNISLLQRLLTDTRNISGIRSWPIEQPTSSLTHPRMFDHFGTMAANFYFHRMIPSNHLIVSIDDARWQPFQYGVMLPWIRCALTEDCIAPLGSQWRSTCRLDKKPHYRYSGCHHYDMSALNVVLGIAFNFSSSEYVASQNDRFYAPFYKLNAARKASTTPMTDPSSVIVAKSTLIAQTRSNAEDDEDFDYSDYDLTSSMHRHLDESTLESEERFDRVLTDAELPEDQRRPVPTLSSKLPAFSTFSSSSLSNPSATAAASSAISDGNARLL